jgi:hypothetical protein
MNQKIMRRFTTADLTIDPLSLYGTFEGFTHNSIGTMEDKVRALVAMGMTFLRELDVLRYPEPPGRNPYEAWVLANIPPLANDKGIYSYMPTFDSWQGAREESRTRMWDWSAIEAPAIFGLVDHLMWIRGGLTNSGGGFLLRNFWLGPREWMFSPDGAPISDYDPMRWYYWRRNISFFLTRLRKRFLLRKEVVMTTGEMAAEIMPVMFANAHWNEEITELLFPQHPGNMVSVYPLPPFSQWAIDLWLQHGGWIGFAGPGLPANDPVMMRAYADAAEQRQQAIG